MKPAKDQFDISILVFPGSAADQARFLLRTVRPLGNVDAAPANLPEILKAALEGRLQSPEKLKLALRRKIAILNLSEKDHLGGSLDDPLSKSGNLPALYLVIHDTSSPTLSFGSSFPSDIDTPSWRHNNLSQHTDTSDPVAHLFVNRVGESRTGHDFKVAHGATKLETDSKGLGHKLVGRFLHTELIQPRINNKSGNDEFAPNPGFSDAQLARLALLYVCVSIRAGRWLIPAFHCVLDEGICNGHDDPQNFSLPTWGRSLELLLNSLGEGQVGPEVKAEPGGPEMIPHPGFRDLAAILAKTDLAFPSLKPVTLAHWALASNWGHSTLAVDLRNYANLPYREEIAGIAESAFHRSDNGTDGQWCSFNSLRSFIIGYWRWLQREPYRGWEKKAADPVAFMTFVGKIFSGGIDSYSERVLALLPRATELLASADEEQIHAPLTNGTPVSDLLGKVSLASLTTSDGYTPPTLSQDLVKGVPFQASVRVGRNYTDRFARWDANPKGKSDPSLCKGLYRFPDQTLFWESKMAIDADGSPHESVLKSSGGSDPHTSLSFKSGAPVNPEIVPYFVAPTYDDPKRAKPGKPFEGSKDRFTEDFSLRGGNLGIVIFRGKLTGAIFADEGPAAKIGEASIRVHELLRKPPAPWKDKANLILLDASEEKGILYFVFPDTFFDINAFGPTKQKQMADAIHVAAMERFEKLKVS